MLNHELAYLRAIFNELERLGEWREPNPLANVRGLRFDETEMAYLVNDQMNLLLECLRTLGEDVLLVTERFQSPESWRNACKRLCHLSPAMKRSGVRWMRRRWICRRDSSPTSYATHSKVIT